MKRVSIILICIILVMNLTSCIGDKVNPNLAALGLRDKSMQRIAVTNNRYAGRYTIIDKKTIEDFTNIVLNAVDATKDSKLDPDFIFEFFDNTRNVATFKYIADINDNKTANLIDSNGRLYNVSTSIENLFVKRLMNRDDIKNVADYYISLIKLLIEKANVNSNDIIVVDISRDVVVTRSITSIEQRDILNSIDSKGKIVFPNETNKHDYYIKISTSKYGSNSCTAIAAVTDKNNLTIKYDIVGTYEDGGWNYHIKYK
jgi:hypothetical protein